MKKRLALSVLLCCCLLLTLLAACNGDDEPAASSPPEGEEQGPAITATAVYTIDFSDGLIGFLAVNTGIPGTDPGTSIEVRQVDGASALAITTPNGNASRIGINIDGLLGDKVTSVKSIVMDIYAEYPDGTLRPVSGKIEAMSGSLSVFAETAWQIYIENRNPTQVVFETGENGFSAQGPNLIEFSCITNDAADRGETPAVIYIKSISFFDDSGTGIASNTMAGFAAPDGYGELNVATFDLPAPPPRTDGDWWIYQPAGVDGHSDDYLPQDILFASYGIVFEMDDDPGEDSIVFVHFGAHNNWAWAAGEHKTVGKFWNDGKLIILWQNVGFKPSDLQDDFAFKMQFGNWSGIDVKAVYLIYDEEAVN